MKKSLLYWFMAIVVTPLLAVPAVAVDGLVGPQLSTMDLSTELGAMPLVSRSLSELAADSAGSSDVGSIVQQAGSYSYDSGASGPNWLISSLSSLDSLVEPFYLTLLGAGLLLLGTVTRSRDS